MQQQQRAVSQATTVLLAAKAGCQDEQHVAEANGTQVASLQAPLRLWQHAGRGSSAWESKQQLKLLGAVLAAAAVAVAVSGT
jgi:hypothetical protein